MRPEMMMFDLYYRKLPFLVGPGLPECKNYATNGVHSHRSSIRLVELPSDVGGRRRRRVG